MGVGLPVVEIAGDFDAPRVRRPDGEMHARLTVAFDRMRAELFVGAVVGAAAQQVEVEVGDERVTHG